ncbi:MAG: hypothetical protein H0T43_04700, partial [Solirubrobacterales bacterium]|nr:hypothetical protein [Solirubrobacterales bacterium]
PGTAPPAAVTPPARTAPPSFAPRPGAPANTRYRARISRISVSKTRRVAKLRLTCPAAAPKGCLVKVNAQVAGKRAAKGKWALLLRNTSQTVKMRLTSTAAKRLRTKGGAVRMSARTYLTSMSTVSKTFRVKRPRRR